VNKLKKWFHHYRWRKIHTVRFFNQCGSSPVFWRGTWSNPWIFNDSKGIGKGSGWLPGNSLSYNMLQLRVLFIVRGRQQDQPYSRVLSSNCCEFSLQSNFSGTPLQRRRWEEGCAKQRVQRAILLHG